MIRQTRFFKCFLAGLIALSLAFSSTPANALRPTGLEESSQRDDLEAALTSGNPDAALKSIRRAFRDLLAPSSPLATTGLEEVVRQWNWGQQATSKAYVMRSTEAVHRLTARLFFEAVERAVKRKGKAIVNFALGSTPIPVYEILVNAYGGRQDIWQHVYPRLEDEYVGLSPDDPRSFSYYLAMDPGILTRLRIPRENWQLIREDQAAPEAVEAQIHRFENLIHQTGKLDVTLNGLGSNAHLYYNEPARVVSEATLEQLKRRETQGEWVSKLNDVSEVILHLPREKWVDAVQRIVQIRGKDRRTNFFPSEERKAPPEEVADIQAKLEAVSPSLRFIPQPFFEARTRLLELSEDTLNYFGLKPHMRRVITQGMGNILQADTVILIATGSKKAEAVRATLEGPVTPEVPSSGLQRHPRVVAIFDPAAASLLRQESSMSGLQELSPGAKALDDRLRKVASQLKQEWPEDVRHYLDYPDHPEVRFAVHLGSDVMASSSPPALTHLYNNVLKLTGIRLISLPLDTPEADLAETLQQIWEHPRVILITATEPHKTKVPPIVESWVPSKWDSRVHPIRAIGNLLLIREAGRVKEALMTNSDGPSFVQQFKTVWGRTGDQEGSFEDKKVVILGGWGGLGHALAISILKEGPGELVISEERNYSKATQDQPEVLKQLSEHRGIQTSYKILPANDPEDSQRDHPELLGHLKDADVIINATALGMDFEDTRSPIRDLSVFQRPSDKPLIVIDSIYRTKKRPPKPRLVTPFLQDAWDQGVREVYNGVGLYVRDLAWEGPWVAEHFTGQRINPNEQESLYDALYRWARKKRGLREAKEVLSAQSGSESASGVEEEKTQPLQIRVGDKRTAQAMLESLVERVQKGLISKEAAIRRLEVHQLEQLLYPTFDEKAKEAATLLGVGIPASPGVAYGRIVFTSQEAKAWKGRGETTILVRQETSLDDHEAMNISTAILTGVGGITSYAAGAAREMGKPAVVGMGTLQIDEATHSLRVGDRQLEEGDWISLDGMTGEVFLGQVPMQDSEIVQVERGRLRPEDSSIYRYYRTLLGWADEIRRLQVWANVSTPEEARLARSLGAQGIGLVRTEAMFRENPLDFQQLLFLSDEGVKRQAYERMLSAQRDWFISLLRTMEGLPVAIRTLDAPLHAFTPRSEEEFRRLAALDLGISEDEVSAEAIRLLQKTVNRWRGTNPMMGVRGIRLQMLRPDILELQIRAMLEAVATLQKEGQIVKLKILIPMVTYSGELQAAKKVAERVAEEVSAKEGIEVRYEFGTMIESPQAAITMDEIAQIAQFGSFGTNDLTQFAAGLRRGDVGPLLAKYQEEGMAGIDPLITLDQSGVGLLITIAVQKARKAVPSFELGVCGEHAGDPASIPFFAQVGLNYVSVVPLRVPVARLVAAQESVPPEESSRNELILSSPIWQSITDPAGRILFDGKILIDPATGVFTIRRGDPVVELPFELWGLRHGQTQANLLKLLSGVSDGQNDQLTELGRDQARGAAKTILAEPSLRLRIERGELILMTSPLKRARETAKIIAQVIQQNKGVKVEVVVDDEAKEFNYGEADGKSDDQFTPEQQQQVDRIRQGLDAQVRVNQGESFIDLILRRQRALEALQGEERYRGKAVVLVGHGMQLNADRILLGDERLLDHLHRVHYRGEGYTLLNAVPTRLVPLTLGGLEEDPAAILLDPSVPWAAPKRLNARVRLQGLFLSSGLQARIRILEVLFKEMALWRKTHTQQGVDPAPQRVVNASIFTDFTVWIARNELVAKAVSDTLGRILQPGADPRMARSLEETVTWLYQSALAVRTWKDTPAARRLEQLHRLFAGQGAPSAAPPQMGQVELAIQALESLQVSFSVEYRNRLDQAIEHLKAGSYAEALALVDQQMDALTTLHGISSDKPFYQNWIAAQKRIASLITLTAGPPAPGDTERSGLEEIQVKTVQELEATGEEGAMELAERLRQEGKPVVMLLPASAAAAQPESSSVSLYAHLKVAFEVQNILFGLWKDKKKVSLDILPSDDSLTANWKIEEATREATQEAAQGRSVLIAVDHSIKGLVYPDGHPVVLLIDPNTWDQVEPEALSALLARSRALINSVLDLTSGKIHRVTLQDQVTLQRRQYFAIDLSA